jgi:hypothetical protein
MHAGKLRMTIFLLTIGVLALGMVLVVYGTVVRNNWGINLAQSSRCGTQLPEVRRATSLHQAMRGGYTCWACGADVDKWGREVQPR